jgi:hypothetical protein
MTTQIYANRTLDSITQAEWVTILKVGAFRGKKINRLASSLTSAQFTDLVYKPKKHRVSCYTKSSFKVNLENIKKCKTTWTIARLIHWIKQYIFCVDQTDFNAKIDHLAEGIYSKLHPSLSTEQKIVQMRNLHFITADDLNAFLDDQATEISTFAIKNSSKWIEFSARMRKILEDSQDNTQIMDRLNRLDEHIIKFLGIETHYYAPYTYSDVDHIIDAIPHDVWNIIIHSQTAKHPISQQLHSIYSLYKKIFWLNGVIVNRFIVKN